jgi:hypothetical protein
MTRKQLQLLNIDELRALRYTYLSITSTDKNYTEKIRRATKRVTKAIEVKQIIAEFHNNRLVPSTEKIFRKAKKNESK